MARILIVDDDPHIAESLRERFSARGFYTGVAVDGVEALEQVREQKPDIVLLDLQMPKMDGFGVLEKFREEGIDCTVIVITAFGNVEKAVEAMKAGAYDFLQKPFEPSLLEETVRRALERQKMKRAIDNALASRPYSDEVTAVLQSLMARTDTAGHPLLEPHDAVENAAVVVITADRGLCGSFNNGLLRKLDSKLGYTPYRVFGNVF